MSLTEVQVETSDLKLGMYVSRLDRPWLETPYRVQGFLIRAEEDIKRLQRYCEHVFVDTEKSRSKDNSPKQVKHLTEEQQKELLIGAKPRQYQKQSKFDDEIRTAFSEHAVLSNAIKGVVEQTTQNNRLDLPTINKAVMPMVESVIRNPDAFAWLTMMKKRDDYAYNHSVSAAIWAAAFGRNLGLPTRQIQMVSMGALLFDLGKVKLPEKLIKNPNLYNEIEHNLIKKHIDYSLEIVESIDGINNEIIEMVATHHERHDGSGYPNGLKKNEIPLFGKIAGIIDCYDAIISDRPHASAISPHDAIKNMYEWSGSLFQSELVEQFIQVVGVYPVGTLVELSDGRIGVVVAHNQIRRLRPRVMLIMDKNKHFMDRFKKINLYLETEDEQGNPLNITRTVKPSTYGIDPSQFYF